MSKVYKLFLANQHIQHIFGKIIGALRSYKSISEKRYLDDNRKLIYYKKSDTCYVIGLGPSLKSVDLKKLDGDSIVTNRFFRFECDDSFKPTYYCMMDSAYFTGKYNKDFLDAIKAYPETPFIVNGRHRKKIQDMVRSDQQLYYFYEWNGRFSANSSRINLTKIQPMFGNVVCCAIGVALGLGYKKIYLLGCDFNSFATTKPVHCYSEENNDRSISLAFELFCYSFVAASHYQLNAYANKHSQIIMNATVGSLIDAYEFDDITIQKLSREKDNDHV